MSRDREKDRKYDSRNMARKQQQEFQAEERSIRASVSVSEQQVFSFSPLYFSLPFFFFKRCTLREISSTRTGALYARLWNSAVHVYAA